MSDFPDVIKDHYCAIETTDTINMTIPKITITTTTATTTQITLNGEKTKSQEMIEFSSGSSAPKEDTYLSDNPLDEDQNEKDDVPPPSLSKKSSFSSISCSTHQDDDIPDASSSMIFPPTGTWWGRNNAPSSLMETQYSYDIAAKIILLGDYNVGKTSFLNTLSRAKDEDGNGSCKEYRVNELAEVVFRRDGKRAMVRVMDTGGQERYRSMTSSYYRGVHGCLLIFDVTKEDSFNNIMSWHQDLSKYCTDQYVTSILVGNTSHPGDRAVSSERGFKLAESLGIPYMECSPGDEVMASAIVQRLMEKIIKVGLRRTSFCIEIKPQPVETQKPQVKQIVCLC